MLGYSVLVVFWIFFKKYLCFLSGGEETPVTSPAGTPKKTKVEPYKLTSQQKSLIKSDEANEKLWNEVLEALKDGPVHWAFPPAVVVLFPDTNPWLS